VFGWFGCLFPYSQASQLIIVIDILRDAVFEDSKSYGVKYSRYFNPISVNLLALVFTMVGPLAATVM